MENLNWENSFQESSQRENFYFKNNLTKFRWIQVHSTLFMVPFHLREILLMSQFSKWFLNWNTNKGHQIAPDVSKAKPLQFE